MRRLFRAISRALPARMVVKGIGSKTIFPFYHLVSNNPPSHVKHLYHVLSANEFERDLDFLLKYFTPIDSKTLIDNLSGNTKIQKPTFFLSFDDGFREVKDIITPILLRKGIPATFFVNPAYIGNHDLMYRCKISLIVDRLKAANITGTIYNEIAKLLGVNCNSTTIIKALFQVKHNQSKLLNEIAELIDVDIRGHLSANQPYLALDDLLVLAKSGFAIGGHGYNHPYFNEISFEEQVSEVMRCMGWVTSNFPDQPKLFAFPFTDYGITDNLLNQLLLTPDGSCDITFGTCGIQPVRFPKHLQRIPMELNGISGKRLLSSEIMYYLAKKKSGYYRVKYDKNL
ncbi:MAG: polysaccharide deacetylase family protein [Bacteroidales bacterium]|nr:polysaccharide deacetylase family protein [Bacteroidales bacterium]